MQIYAWGNMLTFYSKESGLLQGAKDTFSGEKPCEMCCKIAEAKKAEGDKKQESPAPVFQTKLPHDFMVFMEDELAPPHFTPAPVLAFVGHLFPDGKFAHSPPVPPPRR